MKKLEKDLLNIYRYLLNKEFIAKQVAVEIGSERIAEI
tara:strand:- start:3902 stop:4015 length:114 start_codon:yes stop_codon:yes gene_type:complete